MRFRKLCIAWSVLWGIDCVLLIVLWVRSYSQDDVLVHHANHRWIPVLESEDGRLTYYLSVIPDSTLEIPYWVPVVFITALAIVPWIRQLRWRFSLRTLLIAMALIAVVLGLAVYAARN
jgi:hypothetical protein